MATSHFISEILEQPRALDATFAALSGRPWLTDLKHILSSSSQIVLTGMGASFHALQVLFVGLVESEFRPVMIEAGELLHYGMRLLGPGAVIVVVSQSGRSAEVVRIAEKCPSDVTIVAVTNDEGSPLALRSSYVVPTHAGPETCVSSKTYVSSVAVLSQLSSYLTAGPQAAAEVCIAPQLVAQYLSNWTNYVEALCLLLEGVRTMFLVGRGPSIAAAATGGLLIKEGAGFWAEGMPAASFRHGPIEVVGRGVFVLVFQGMSRTESLCIRLAEEIERKGATMAICGSASREGVFRLPAAPANVLPILEILPVQLIIVALAKRSGRVPGELKLSMKVTDQE